MMLFSVAVVFLFRVFSLAGQPPAFDNSLTPPAPDYSVATNWAALPFRNDLADMVPKGLALLPDSAKQVDVFFVHPTTYGKGNNWNARVDDAEVNRKTDEKPIKYQASVFNEVARVYAPRYRQAIYASFSQMNGDGSKALELAYTDVRSAFQFYLDHYNQGRPIIIASHSQGTWHTRLLLKEFFDGKPLQQQLVAAYIAGYSVPADWFQALKACSRPDETGCICSWASYLKGYEPAGSFYRNAICVNPVSWSSEVPVADRSMSCGSMLFNFDKRLERACGAQVHNNYLWVDTRLALVRSRKNLHIGDYNLFWYDIRDNVKHRTSSYFGQRKEHYK